MSVLDDSVKRCSRCGWPLVDRIEDGCTEGNCSMRPMPPIREEAKMTAFHAVGEPKESATTLTTLRAENERLREQADALKHLVNAASEVDEAIGYRDWKRVASRGKTLTAALVLARAALKGGA